MKVGGGSGHNSIIGHDICQKTELLVVTVQKNWSMWGNAVKLDATNLNNTFPTFSYKMCSDFTNHR